MREFSYVNERRVTQIRCKNWRRSSNVCLQCPISCTKKRTLLHVTSLRSHSTSLEFLHGKNAVVRHYHKIPSSGVEGQCSVNIGGMEMDREGKRRCDPVQYALIPLGAIVIHQ